MTGHPATATIVAVQSNMHLRRAFGRVPYAFPIVPAAAVLSRVSGPTGAQAAALATGARADAGPSTSTAGISTAAATSPITIV